MAQFCGGIRLDNTFKIAKGVITTHDNLIPVQDTVNICSQPFDAGHFEIVKVEGKEVLTAIGAITPIPVKGLVKSPCGGLYFDGRYFTLNDGVLTYTA